jgi:hypothetical protein
MRFLFPRELEPELVKKRVIKGFKKVGLAVEWTGNKPRVLDEKRKLVVTGPEFTDSIYLTGERAGSGRYGRSQYPQVLFRLSPCKNVDLPPEKKVEVARERWRRAKKVVGNNLVQAGPTSKFSSLASQFREYLVQEYGLKSSEELDKPPRSPRSRVLVTIEDFRILRKPRVKRWLLKEIGRYLIGKGLLEEEQETSIVWKPGKPLWSFCRVNVTRGTDDSGDVG